MRPESSRPLAAVLCTAAFFILSCGLVFNAAWIPVKAELAQKLLERSWHRVRSGASDARPWPWADTQAVARLEVSRLEVDQIVLEGSSGRNLAFGPTLSAASRHGPDWVISGHRDTHFSFLQELRTGDILRLETPGAELLFYVDSLEIIDSRAWDLLVDPGLNRLSLVTCYPFNAITTGGPLRYVVTALPLNSPGLSQPLASSG